MINIIDYGKYKISRHKPINQLIRNTILFFN